jgi:hypothetical protein
MGGTCIRYGERQGAYRVLMGKPEGKRPLGRPRIDGRIILSSSVKLIGPWMFLILSTTLVIVPAGYVFDPKRYWQNPDKGVWKVLVIGGCE